MICLQVVIRLTFLWVLHSALLNREFLFLNKGRRSFHIWQASQRQITRSKRTQVRILFQICWASRVLILAKNGLNNISSAFMIVGSFLIFYSDLPLMCTPQYTKGLYLPWILSIPPFWFNMLIHPSLSVCFDTDFMESGSASTASKLELQMIHRFSQSRRRSTYCGWVA